MLKIMALIVLSMATAVSATAQTIIDITYLGSNRTGAWALADSGDYFHKNQNTVEHIWEHWGNVFEVAGVDPDGREFVGMAGWGSSNLALVALCGNGDVFAKDQSTEPLSGWSYVTNLFTDSGHGTPGTTEIVTIEEYASVYVQVLCDNGEWYKTTGDPINTGVWEHVGNIFEMAGFDPVSVEPESMSSVKSLFR